MAESARSTTGSLPASSCGPRWPASPEPAALHASFSNLALYRACPLKYRFLEVERLPEPPVLPDWRRAPAESAGAGASVAAVTVASELDRRFGAAVHLAMLRWQRRVDGGAAPRAADLLAEVRQEAGRGAAGDDRRAAGDEVERALERVGPGLSAYAGGPWPRRATLFLEQRVRHRLEDGSGFAVELALRVDRVVRYQRQVAILDFKTVPPHAFELAVDQWQLRTYALAAPALLGVDATRVRLFLIDLRSGDEVPVGSTRAQLAAAEEELLGAARGIAGAQFGVDDAPGRPCWACGFRLACPSSLAPGRRD